VTTIAAVPDLVTTSVRARLIEPDFPEAGLSAVSTQGREAL